MIDNFIKDEKLEEAYRLAKKINDFSALRAVAEAYAEKGEFSRAYKIASEIMDEYYRSSALKGVTRHHYKAAIMHLSAGEVDRAYRVAKEIKDEYYRSRIFKELVEEYKLSGDIERARKIAENIKDEPWRSFIFADISEMYIIKKRNLKKAERIADDIKNSLIKSWALKNVSVGYIKEKKDYKKARAILNKIYKILEKEDAFKRSLILTFVAEIYSEMEDFDRAYKTLAEAYETAKEVKNMDDIFTIIKAIGIGYRKVSSKCIKAGMLSKAYETARNIKEGILRNVALSGIAVACAEVDKKEAYRIANELEEPFRTEILKVI